MAEGGSGPQNLRIESSEKQAQEEAVPLQGNSDMATAVEQAVACIQVRAARMYHATVLQSPRATSRVPQADLPSAALACFCAPDDVDDMCCFRFV